MENPALSEALTLALRLSPKERLYLISRVASSVEQVLEETTHTEPWGQRAERLIEQLDTSAWQDLDIPDVTTWLHQLRDEERKQRGRDWDEVS
ncbi:MAG: hypothetical protein MUC99_10970 [Anaerolineae bacterium]|jgi:hypothetical protein|nr:hypothetical protein [Anaerolineae bacterium]